LAGLYTLGAIRLRRRSRVPVLKAWRIFCYYTGLLSLALALLSPISTFSAVFFFCHMIEHLLLLLVAPSLLWLGSPLVPTLWAFPRAQRRALGRMFGKAHPVYGVFSRLTSPSLALTFYSVDMAVWHLPSLYSLAEGPTLIHGIEHALFLVTALLFWWPVVQPNGGRRRLGYGVVILYLLIPNLESMAIGVLLSLASAPIYPYYAAIPHPWGISVLIDQQIGGLIMWVGAGLFLLVATTIAFLCWFAEEEKRDSDINRDAGRDPRVVSATCHSVSEPTFGVH
jgi:cytochrome c oxidase assembly factor CtaG